MFVSFAHEDLARSTTPAVSLTYRTEMLYKGEMLLRFLRTCPAVEMFPYQAEALHWESVAGNTVIFPAWTGHHHCGGRENVSDDAGRSESHAVRETVKSGENPELVLAYRVL